MDHSATLNNSQAEALIVTGFGINCEIEMAAAYRLAGAKATIVHINDIFSGECNIHDYDVLNFPGGFSFGDDLGSGKVMANKIKFKNLPSGKTLLEEIKSFLKEGKFILGICNGFQFLVRLGLVPNTGLRFAQEATLAQNDSGQFEDRWVYCKVNPRQRSPFFKGMDVFPVPVRHGEGKLIIKESLAQKVVKDNLHAITYCQKDGTPATAYPANPNGSFMSIAGLTDTSGQVLGLMPHPEAFLSLYNHPDWPKLKAIHPDLPEEGIGLRLFKNIVNHIKIRKQEWTLSK